WLRLRRFPFWVILTLPLKLAYFYLALYVLQSKIKSGTPNDVLVFACLFVVSIACLCTWSYSLKRSSKECVKAKSDDPGFQFTSTTILRSQWLDEALFYGMGVYIVLHVLRYSFGVYPAPKAMLPCLIAAVIGRGVGRSIHGVGSRLYAIILSLMIGLSIS